MDKYLVIIEGGWNDGGYAYNHLFFKEEDLEELKQLTQIPAIIEEALRVSGIHCLDDLVNAIENFDESDEKIIDELNITPEVGNLIYTFWEDYMPFCHSLKSIEIYTLADEQTNFNI